MKKKQMQKYVGAGLVSARTGITLVALVITIIILLILAAITINLTIGQRGILTRAQEAGKNYQEAAKKEDEDLAKLWNEAENILTGSGEIGGDITNPPEEGGEPNPPIPEEPEISEAVKGLKVGDYIKYDTGVTSVGTNGVITCRVLYTVENEQNGLQIISNSFVGNWLTLGGNDWETGKTAYNGAIERLNREAETYVNTKYANDGRCVGSIPTVENGVFINKNNASEDILDTGCYSGDSNYVSDQAVLKVNGMYGSGMTYWLASRTCVWRSSTECDYGIRTLNSSGTLTFYTLCHVYRSEGHSGSSNSYRFRPCFSLKSNIIKITGGDGKTEATAYTIGI